jgi:16S rRNA (guanine1207-N2)-methyltransferase
MTVTDSLLVTHIFVHSGDTDTVVLLNCADCASAMHVAAHAAARVVVTDRNFAAVHAAARELPANVQVIHAHGTHGIAAELRADVVGIRSPREKLSAVQLLADAFRALRVDGRCVLAGANREGVKSVAALAERAFGNAEVLGHDSGHRAVAFVKRADEPVDPSVFDNPLLAHDNFHVIEANVRERLLKVHSRPGVFSWEHIDDATLLLAETMDIAEGEEVLDLGCGSGVLGTVAAALSRTGRVVMVDADIEAVRSARRTAEASAATSSTSTAETADTASTARTGSTECLPSDVASAVTDEKFDVVVTNPPFHAGGRATDLDLPLRFIRDAHHVLRRGGRLYLVANRTLPYEREIATVFGNVTALHETSRFKILRASR